MLGTRRDWRALGYALDGLWPTALWAAFPSLAFGIWQGSLAASLFAFFIVWPVWIRMER